MTETETKQVERREVTIGVVFATYHDVVPSLVPGGQDRIVARSANRGQTVSVPEREAQRLEAIGALSTPDQAQAIIDRALNPSDDRAEGAGAATGEPVTVSPPAMGAEPAGDLTKGDTGGDDVQPVATTTTPDGREVVTFDADGATVDEAAAWLRDARPTAPQVVDAAGDDGEAAETLLEAERLVTSGDPRKTVESGLQAIIDGDNGGSGS